MSAALGSWRGFAIAGRVGVAALLILALLDPRLPWQRPVRDVIVLVDVSASVGARAAAEGWRRARDVLTDLSPSARVSVIDFAAAPAVAMPSLADGSAVTWALVDADHPPPMPPVDGSATDVAAAVELALTLVRPERPADLLLITDGEANRGDTAAALSRARAFGLRVFAVPVPGVSATSAHIEALTVPAHARVGDAVPVAVAVAAASGARDGELGIALNGHAVASEAVHVPAGGVVRRQFTLRPDHAGEATVEARFSVGGTEIDRQQAVVTVEAPVRILYVGNAADGPFISSLRHGGRTVSAIPPRRLLAAADDIARAGVIILDDVAVDDLPAEALAQIDDAVVHHECGLIVAGGPHAFAAGGYHHSRLETLLPVTAEPPREEDHAAVEFVVDRSGSMGESQHGSTRYAEAVRAVRETTRGLEADDLMGLIVFDAEAQTVVPLGPWRDRPTAAEPLRRQLPLGGTRVAPALERGIEALSGAAPRQKLLVLVTDGALGEAEDFAAASDGLRRQGIDLIVILIGGADAGPLAELARINDGRLLRVDDIAELPRLMRASVDERRQPAVLAPTGVVVARRLPFLSEAGAWPDVGGHDVVRTRDGASVFLRTPTGDPLLIEGAAGLGLVVALPAGIGAWVQPWTDWPPFGRFVGGLVDWVSPRTANPRLQVRVDDEAGHLRFTVDATGRDGSWATATEGGIVLEDPGGAQRHLPLTASGPGRYVVEAPISAPGRYRAAVRVGDDVARTVVIEGTDRERVPAPGVRRRWADLIAKGLVTALPPGRPLPPAAAATGENRPAPLAFVLAALVLYAGTIIIERTGHRLAAGLSAWRPAVAGAALRLSALARQALDLLAALWERRRDSRRAGPDGQEG